MALALSILVYYGSSMQNGVQFTVVGTLSIYTALIAIARWLHLYVLLPEPTLAT